MQGFPAISAHKPAIFTECDTSGSLKIEQGQHFGKLCLPAASVTEHDTCQRLALLRLNSSSGCVIRCNEVQKQCYSGVHVVGVP